MGLLFNCLATESPTFSPVVAVNVGRSLCQIELDTEAVTYIHVWELKGRYFRSHGACNMAHIDFGPTS
eukprot:6471531-Amphidinium_carterae.1